MLVFCWLPTHCGEQHLLWIKLHPSEQLHSLCSMLSEFLCWSREEPKKVHGRVCMLEALMWRVSTQGMISPLNLGDGSKLRLTDDGEVPAANFPSLKLPGQADTPAKSRIRCGKLVFVVPSSTTL